MIKVVDMASSLLICVFLMVIMQVKGQQDDIRVVFENCKQESKATEEDITTFKNQQLPTTVTGKCMLACMFNSSGLMQNGKYNVDGALKLTGNVYAGNPERQEKAKQVVDRCSKQVENETDKCEIASKVAQCTMTVSTELGLM